MQRLIDGPNNDWSTLEEAAQWLRISESMFKKLVADGEMPKPHRRGDRAFRWYWLDLVSYAYVFGRGEGEIEPSK